MIARGGTVTAAAYETIVMQHSDRRFELIHGEIVEKVPTQIHAYIVGIIAHLIITYLQANPIGYALVEAHYSLPDDVGNHRIPDLSFVSKEKGLLLKEGAAPYMPDLAVEVQSPGQSDRFMMDRAAYYLAHGSRMVWLVYPEKRLVEILTANERYLLTEHEAIHGGDVLPGFSAAIRDVLPTE